MHSKHSSYINKFNQLAMVAGIVSGGLSSCSSSIESLRVAEAECAEGGESCAVQVQTSGTETTDRTAAEQKFPIKKSRTGNSTTPGAVEWEPVKGAESYLVTVANDEVCKDVVETQELKTPKYTASGLSDGAYFVCIQALDAGKKLIGEALNNGLPLLIDTQPPQYTLAGIPEAPLAQSSLTLSFVGSEAVSYRVALGPVSLACDDEHAYGQVLPVDGTEAHIDLSLAPEGPLHLCIVAADAAGNWEAIANAQPLTIVSDRTAPALGAPAPLVAASVITMPALTSETGLTYAWQQLSGPGAAQFSDVGTATPSVAFDADGVYVVQVKAWDAANNLSTAQISVTWDETPPVVGAGMNQTVTGTATMTGSATDATAMVLAWSKVSGPGTVTFSDPTTTSPTVQVSAVGTYVLRLTATDVANHSTSSDVTLTVQAAPGTVSAGSDVITNALVTLGATASSDVTGATWTKVSGPGTVNFGTAAAVSTTVSVSQDGTYILRISGTDGNGTSISDDMQLIWDTQAPSVNVNSPGAGSYVTSTNLTAFAVGGSCSESGGTVHLSGDVTTTATCDGSGWTKTLDLTSLGQGSFTIYANLTDAAGNPAPQASRVFAKDTVPPDAPSVQATTPTTDTTPTWSWTSGGGGNGTFRYRLDDGDMTTGTTTTTDLEYTPGSGVGVGTHTLYVQERDAAGLWSDAGSFALTVSAAASTPTSSINTSGTIGPASTGGTTTTFSGTGTDSPAAAGLDKVEVSLMEHNFYGEVGTWTEAGSPGLVESGRVATAAAEARAIWTINASLSGSYAVYVTYVQDPSLATNASYSVYDGATLRGNVTVDQTVAPADAALLGRGWKKLGDFTISSGRATIVLTSFGANGDVYADAARIESLATASIDQVIDSDDASGFSVVGTWNTTTTTTAAAYNGNYRSTNGSSGAGGSATWSFTGLPAGYYAVSSTWINNSSSTCKGGPYSVFDDTTQVFTQQVDFRSAIQGGETINSRPFYKLGTVYISSGTLKVRLVNNFACVSPNLLMIADAVRVKGVSNNGGVNVAIIDNGGTGYSEQGGGWANASIAGAGYNNTLRAVNGTGKSATWSFTGLEAGAYAVYAAWQPSSNRVTDAAYAIADGSTVVATATVNQQVAPGDLTVVNGINSSFLLLGVVKITSGVLNVTVTTPSASYTIADAVLIQEQTFLVDNSSRADRCLNAGKTAFDATCPSWNAASGTATWEIDVNDSVFTTGRYYSLRSKATDNAAAAESMPPQEMLLWDASH